MAVGLHLNLLPKGVPQVRIFGLGITQTTTTISLYSLNRSSVVTRCSGSLIACAISIRSKDRWLVEGAGAFRLLNDDFQ